MSKLAHHTTDVLRWQTLTEACNLGRSFRDVFFVIKHKKCTCRWISDNKASWHVSSTTLRALKLFAPCSITSRSFLHFCLICSDMCRKKTKLCFHQTAFNTICGWLRGSASWWCCRWRFFWHRYGSTIYCHCAILWREWRNSTNDTFKQNLDLFCAHKHDSCCMQEDLICGSMGKRFYRLMDELKFQMALASIGVGLCSGL